VGKQQHNFIMDNKIDYAPFKAYLNNLAPISEAEWGALCDFIYIRHLKRKELFQRSGKICNTIGFILQGCFRSVKELDGEERTFDFSIEQEFVTNYYSILSQKPSEVNIIAVEDSIVVCADAAKLLALFDSSAAWQKIGRRLAEYAACYYSERLISSFYETPKIRFERLMNTTPELFLRIPHHVLANYLGMTKETLSRLRNSSG
jgi:CRP-like cAMP-binding protein